MVDFNGIHKFAGSQYHLILSRQGKIDAIALRLTNAYGPRLALDVSGQGVLGVFFRLAASGQTISVYGDGSQLRDPIYVSDVVDAFLAVGVCASPPSRVYNVGGPEALDMQSIASIIARAAGRGSTVRCVPFPDDQAQVDIGSYVSDCSRIRRELGWFARIPLVEGAQLTLEHIWNSAQPTPREPTARE
jgi:nucleoside-diphosphate-sugar epimerase